MKNKLYLTLMLFALSGFVPQQVLAQSSTEGKDFWVALTLCAAPSNGLPEPFIAVSTKKQTTITITNPNDPGWAGVTRQVTADAWVTFTTQEIPLSQWYPTSANSIANCVGEASKTHNFGLHLTTDEEVSVFAALRMVNSFDAANILPITVLQSEYYTQDYPPYIKPSDGEALSMFTILATENNTKVNITPKTTTYDNHAAGQNYSVTLNAGQTYYVISKTLTSLSGTHVVAEGGKKIAVFQGNVFTQIPGGKSARDCTYEQAMPVDYWGSQFVVTRSMQKDANRIRVTAMENGTDIQINGQHKATIDAGDTYEFEMCNSTLSLGSENPASAKYNAEAVFLASSCPVAVYSYDVSNGYKAGSTEMIDDRGDPSMVWISPIEQKINKITFGACGTNKTKKHFIDIVCLTADASYTKLWSNNRPNIPVTFQQVSSQPQFSYSRTFLTDDDVMTDKVYHLTNPHGIIAHVYGNGDDESYAYSVGSAAVKRGVEINGSIFTDGYRTDGEGNFCINQMLNLNAQVGNDIIDRVDWDFGDGVTLYGTASTPYVEVDHFYDSPGWYDVTAIIYAHKECPETTYPAEPVSFTFRVSRPDTVFRNYFICEGETLNLNDQTYTQAVRDTVAYDCDSVVIFNLEVGKKSVVELDTTTHDSFVLGPHTYYDSGTYHDTLVNAVGCDSVVTVHARVIQCLHMQLGTVSTPVCGDQTEFFIPYVRHKGDVGDAVLVAGNTRTDLEFNNSTDDPGWYVAMTNLVPGNYTSAYVEVQDTNCMENNPVRLPLAFEVLYPSSVFQQKWDDVLAVLSKTYIENNIGHYFGSADVVSYQWYLDGMPIDGATKSVYYVGPDDKLIDGGSYAVQITTSDGKTVLSCPKVIHLDNAAAPANKVKNAVLVAPGVIMIEVNGRKYPVN